MKYKYLVFLCLIGVIITVACGKREVLNESIKNSEEEEMGFDEKPYDINENVFSQFTRKQQKEIKNIINNIKDYDENKVLPDNIVIDIDKDEVVVLENYSNYIIEVGSDNDKVIILLRKDYKDENKFIVKDVHTVNSFLEMDKLPSFEEVDFLNDEQKDKYNRAMDMLSACDVCPTDLCDYNYEEDEDIRTIEAYAEEDDDTYRYYICKNDNFTNYKEFKDYVYNLFSKEFWDNVNKVNVRFIENDGYLYCHEGARGSNMTYVGSHRNKYELISKTGNKIEFYDISFYSCLDHFNDDFKCELAQPVKNKAVLEKIDGEWKFTELVLPW